MNQPQIWFFAVSFFFLGFGMFLTGVGVIMNAQARNTEQK